MCLYVCLYVLNGYFSAGIARLAETLCVCVCVRIDVRLVGKRLLINRSSYSYHWKAWWCFETRDRSEFTNAVVSSFGALFSKGSLSPSTRIDTSIKRKQLFHRLQTIMSVCRHTLRRRVQHKLFMATQSQSRACFVIAQRCSGDILNSIIRDSLHDAGLL